MKDEKPIAIGNLSLAPENEPMAHVSLRIPEYVVEYYRAYPNYTKVMRRVLKAYAEQQLRQTSDEV
jgi:hypothetical protein|tara:strand:- start:4974 stop:5171 length:198 start_codon:yes stop_codon:yes gene_type:complete